MACYRTRVPLSARSAGRRGFSSKEAARAHRLLSHLPGGRPLDAVVGCIFDGDFLPAHTAEQPIMVGTYSVESDESCEGSASRVRGCCRRYHRVQGTG